MKLVPPLKRTLTQLTLKIGNFKNIVNELAKERGAELSQLLKQVNSLSDTMHNEILEAYTHNTLYEIRKTANSMLIDVNI